LSCQDGPFLPKKNPPFGGLKTLFSVGGAFTTTVHDKIVSEIVPDLHPLWGTMSQRTVDPLSARAIGDVQGIFSGKTAVFAPATHRIIIY